MTYAARPSEFVPYRECPAADHAVAKRRGLLRRIYDAVLRSRQTQAERVVAAYLEHTGGRFTDDIERRITERLITGDRRRWAVRDAARHRHRATAWTGRAPHAQSTRQAQRARLSVDRSPDGGTRRRRG